MHFDMMYTLETIPNHIISLIVFLFILAYLFITGILVRKKPRFLWLPVSILLVLSTAFYWYAYGLGGVSNSLARLVLSFTAALDLFFFRMNSTFGHFLDLFYISPVNPVDSESLAAMNRLAILTGLYLCSIWTTSILIMHFFARRVISRLVLAWNWLTNKYSGIHLFIGLHKESVALARSLGKDAKVVFVDVPERDILPSKVSFLQFFQGLRTKSDRSERIRDILPNAYVLKARKPLARCQGKDLFKELGLRLLGRWANLPQTCIYLLSADYSDNTLALQKLSSYPAQVYYHTRRNGLAVRMELAGNGHIHIVDSSFLATEALKSREELYPIRQMIIPKDAEGQPRGYVEGGFRALVCGFGEAGQGVVSFLYEFGAFPDKNKQLNDFHCEVIDGNMPVLEGEFRLFHPGIDPSRVSFREETVGSESFWNRLQKNVQDINYVFISIGDDAENMKSALDILEFVFRSRPDLDRFIIVVKLDRPSLYQSLIDYYNRNYGGKTTIYAIGDIESTWTWNNISGEGFKDTARTFYSSYALASASQLTLEERARRIMAKENVSEIARKLELQRKTTQDFANHFHTRVKRYLCPDYLWKDPSYAADIPLQMMDGKHYIGTDERAANVLDYLAVGEHIRWMCSHQSNGYQGGVALREDLKVHPDIKAYELLTEPVKHYDWVVVKTTLEILGKQYRRERD